MGWPSVHFWGYVFVPGRFLALVAAFPVGLGLHRAISDILGLRVDVMVVIVASMFVLAGLFYLLVLCPRFGRSAYARSGRWSNDLWPVRQCTKCDLDLTRHHPFDNRAKRDKNV